MRRLEDEKTDVRSQRTEEKSFGFWVLSYGWEKDEKVRR